MSDIYPGEERVFEGIAIAPGIAHGPAYVHHTENEELQEYAIEEAALGGEVSRFESALMATRAQILEMQQRIAEAIGARDASIFDAHLLVVEDRTLIDEVLRTLERDRLNVEVIFQRVARRYSDTLGQIDDPYLRERAYDIHDVTRRIIRNLLGVHGRNLAQVDHRHVLVAHNLTPSDTASLNRERALGFATDLGSKTSHTGIMARSLGIPAVAGLHDLSEQLESGQTLLLDGYNGRVVLNPSAKTLEEYGQIEVARGRVEKQLLSLRETLSETTDKRHIILSANIELLEDLPAVREHGAEGIGLYRTEFLYLNRQDSPSEEEQYAAYSRVARETAPQAVIIRTLDLGGDKLLVEEEKEPNPFLGCRAIRLCLENVDLFKPQLRAILRASAEGKVRIMYPMISCVQEVRQANALLEECKAELRAANLPFDENIETGVMIEIPSAALTADLLAREVDFFSIGTNDLIQYTVAVDRLNDRIAYLYQPTHPAVLRLIKRVVDAAHAENIWVGVCGEMAGDIILTPLLVGLGIDELSASAPLVPRVKRAVQSLSGKECLALVEKVLAMDSPERILAELTSVAEAHYSDLLG